MIVATHLSTPSSRHQANFWPVTLTDAELGVGMALGSEDIQGETQSEAFLWGWARMRDLHQTAQDKD